MSSPLHESQLIYFRSFFLSIMQITSMHLAAEGARIRMVNYLVNKGADINIQDDKGVIIYDSKYQCSRIADLVWIRLIPSA